MSPHLIRDHAIFFRVSLNKDFANMIRRVSGERHSDIGFLCPWFDFACSEFCFEQS